MKKILFVLMIMFLSVQIWAQQEIVVDPHASLRTVNGDFSSIRITGGIDLYLSQSDEVAIAVSAAEDKFKDAIKTTIDNGVLTIYYSGDKGWNSGKKSLRVYVSFTKLEKLNASGACDVVVSGSITVPVLDMQLAGACDFKGMVKVNSLKLDLRGASDVKISGTANTVNIESAGASDVKGYELVTEICNVKASGASDINITVNKELNANASGASDIYYKGSALIKEQHSSGASSILRKS